MRAVVSRVTSASVVVDGTVVGELTAPVKVVEPFLPIVRDVEPVLELVVLERFQGDELVARVVLDEQDVDCSAFWCRH